MCDLNAHLIWVSENIVFGWGVLLAVGLIMVLYLAVKGKRST